jgi:hypothetical protein
MTEYEPPDDDLHDLLLDYLDSDIVPVTAAEAMSRACVHAGRRVVRRTSRARNRRTELVAALVLVCSLVVVGLALAARSQPVPATSPSGVVWGAGTGPCVAAPPGCGSPESTAAALGNGTWSTFPTGPLSARTGQVEVWTGHELLVWGGVTPGISQKALGDGAAYDPANKTWKMMPPAPLSPREGAAAAWTGSEMAVVGGSDGARVFGDAAAYDPATNTWRPLASPPLGPLTGATALWTGRQLVIVGGLSSRGGLLSSQSHGVVAYDPATNTWTTLADVPVEAGWSVQSVTPAWTGTELLVWMSWQRIRSSGLFEKDAGYGLDAGTKTWRELTQPIVQTNNAATAWTGSSVLVMGGEYCPHSCPPPVGSGAGYDPATQKWRAIPSFSVVQAQWPASWTGRAFIDTNAGRHGFPGSREHLSAYNPISGRWVLLPPEPSPIAGDDSEAVWTGRQLLVWGQPSEVLTSGTATKATASACISSHLTARTVSGGGEASQPFIVVAVTNHGQTCSIDGYPDIAAASGHSADLLGPSRPLPIRVADGSDYEHPDPGLTSSRLLQGSPHHSPSVWGPPIPCCMT